MYVAHFDFHNLNIIIKVDSGFDSEIERPMSLELTNRSTRRIFKDMQMICIYTSCTPEFWTAMAVLSAEMSGWGDQHRSLASLSFVKATMLHWRTVLHKFYI
jgi:hypothetical protein